MTHPSRKKQRLNEAAYNSFMDRHDEQSDEQVIKTILEHADLRRKKTLEEIRNYWRQKNNK